MFKTWRAVSCSTSLAGTLSEDCDILNAKLIALDLQIGACILSTGGAVGSSAASNSEPGHAAVIAEIQQGVLLRRTSVPTTSQGMFFSVVAMQNTANQTLYYAYTLFSGSSKN